MREIAYTVHTFKESGAFVAYVPEFDLSSSESCEGVPVFLVNNLLRTAGLGRERYSEVLAAL